MVHYPITALDSQEKTETFCKAQEGRTANTGEIHCLSEFRDIIYKETGHLENELENEVCVFDPRKLIGQYTYILKPVLSEHPTVQAEVVFRTGGPIHLRHMGSRTHTSMDFHVLKTTAVGLSPHLCRRSSHEFNTPLKPMQRTLRFHVFI